MFHKSIILVIAEADTHTIGAILNRPVSHGLEVKISDNESGASRNIELPLRFGGEYIPQGEEKFLWLHCNASLRLAQIGSPVGTNENGVWKCTADDVVSALKRGLATPEEFLAISGISVWAKHGSARSLHGEIEKGRFEVIPDKNIPHVWSSLAKQQVLSNSNLSKNLALGEEAWTQGGKGIPDKKKNGNPTPISGLGEGFDEEDDSLVFKSDVKVSHLSDDALRSWISTFFLGVSLLEED